MEFTLVNIPCKAMPTYTVFSCLNDQQQANAGTLIQQNCIGGFGKWNGLLILYQSLIKLPVYCSALPPSYYGPNNYSNPRLITLATLYHSGICGQRGQVFEDPAQHVQTSIKAAYCTSILQYIDIIYVPN